MKGALVFGAVAATTGAIPAIPAMAATVNVPGFGNVDVPGLNDQQVGQVNNALNDHSDQIKQFEQSMHVAPVAPGQPAPGLPGFAAPGVQMPGVHQTAATTALDAAKTKIGSDYVWGASGPASFDCSGLVQWAYKQAGITLPRTSFEMSHVGQPVAFQDLQPGDLVIQEGGGHVAMYAGDGKILQAPQSGETVSYAPLHQGTVVTARRVG